ncbi:MAG: hypothetical protein M9908_15470 [Phyllobacteriaceae bacterium]|nr:hypothetical protein [Phyllobacteriaceae bacterium]
MNDRTLYRLQDIIEAIDLIDGLLSDVAFEELYHDTTRRAAFERFLEILSKPHATSAMN